MAHVVKWVVYMMAIIKDPNEGNVPTVQANSSEIFGMTTKAMLPAANKNYLRLR